jgi:serine/threonine-protein kinase
VPPAEPGITAGGTAQIRARVAWTAAAVFAFAAGIALWALWRGQPSPLLARLPVDLGSDVALANPPGGAASNTVVISRDGSRLAFIASVGDGPQRVHVRRIDTIADTPPLALPGTDGATGLAFSPDGQSLAFTAGARVYRISVDGGAALRLADVVGPNGRSPTQVTWGDGDDVIVSGVALGLYRVRSSGGAAVAVTELLGSEFTHTSAQILPGGKTVLFMVGLTGDDTARIEAVPISGGMRKVIIRNGGSPFYIPTGHLLYVRQTTLFAVRFDPDTLQTIGDAVPLVTDVKTTRAGLLAMGFYDAANNGSLIYRKASDSSALPLFAGSGIESIDLAGKRHRFRIDAASRYFAPRVSPDGDRIALNVLGLAGSMVPEVSVYDIRREDQTKIVSAGGVSLNPTWVPPRGRYLIFTKLVGVSRSELQWKPADGGQPQTLLPAVRVSAGGSFRGDGRKLAFVSFGSSVGGRGTETGRRIFTADVTESDGQLKAGVPELFSPSQFNEFDPEFSPDGRWMAFVTDKSDQNEVWIRAVTSADRKAQASEVKVSSNGGESPRWSANSRQLLYRAGEQILAVSVASDGDGLIVDKPQVRVDKLGGAPPAFDLTRDGRIVIATAVDAPKAPAEHTVVLLQNFFDEVRRRVK